MIQHWTSYNRSYKRYLDTGRILIICSVSEEVWFATSKMGIHKIVGSKVIRRISILGVDKA